MPKCISEPLNRFQKFKAGFLCATMFAGLISCSLQPDGTTVTGESSAALETLMDVAFESTDLEGVERIKTSQVRTSNSLVTTTSFFDVNDELLHTYALEASMPSSAVQTEEPSGWIGPLYYSPEVFTPIADGVGNSENPFEGMETEEDCQEMYEALLNEAASTQNLQNTVTKYTAAGLAVAGTVGAYAGYVKGKLLRPHPVAIGGFVLTSFVAGIDVSGTYIDYRTDVDLILRQMLAEMFLEDCLAYVAGLCDGDGCDEPGDDDPLPPEPPEPEDDPPFENGGCKYCTSFGTEAVAVGMTEQDGEYEANYELESVCEDYTWIVGGVDENLDGWCD